MLFKFIHDITNDPQLQRRFAADPAAVMKSAGLDDHEIAAVTSREMSRISTAMEKRLGGAIGGSVMWFAPTPTIKTPVSPTSGTAGHVIKALTIHGTYFTSAMTAHLENESGVIPLTNIVVTGAGESQSSLTGTVSIPRDALGAYTVRVTTSQSVSATHPRGFSVVACNRCP
jgi:hypothetical protein